MPLTVRAARPDDLAVVVEFNRLLAVESEGKHLDLDRLRPGVAALLADPARGRYFLAEEDGRPLGQISLTYEWSDWRNGWFWWLQSVYVVPEGRRRGVFTALFGHLEALARADPAVIGLRLYVEEGNAAAHATYLRRGFAWTTYRVMERYPL